jgi:hypothetical protein
MSIKPHIIFWGKMRANKANPWPMEDYWQEGNKEREYEGSLHKEYGVGRKEWPGPD